MIDTQPLAPTDAELDELRQANGGKLNFVTFSEFRTIARAVLAKWGTLPAVAGEPIGYLYCGGSYGDELEDWEIVADQRQCDKLNEHHGSLGKEARLPIYTTPQPTQAQAGTAPLTDEQIEALPLWKRFVGLWPETRREIVRTIESAHGIGIKGGQHGTE